LADYWQGEPAKRYLLCTVGLVRVREGRVIRIRGRVDELPDDLLETCRRRGVVLKVIATLVHVGQLDRIL